VLHQIQDAVKQGVLGCAMQVLLPLFVPVLVLGALSGSEKTLHAGLCT